MRYLFFVCNWVTMLNCITPGLESQLTKYPIELLVYNNIRATESAERRRHLIMCSLKLAILDSCDTEGVKYLVGSINILNTKPLKDSFAKVQASFGSRLPYSDKVCEI